MISQRFSSCSISAELIHEVPMEDGGQR